MPDSPSTVTALVPAYNSAAFIQETLDSLSAQTYEHFKVLISVDLCDDDTYEVCMQHAATDPRFTVHRQTERRLGYVGNCNYLMRSADSDYVMLAFHDDLLEPTFTEKLAAALDANPNAVLSFSDVRYTPVEGDDEFWEYNQLEGVTDRVQRGWFILSKSDKWWVPNRGMFRLRRSRRIGGIKLHNAGEFSPDWPWMFHMSLLGEFVRVPELLCHKIRKPESLSRAWDFSDRQWYEALGSCMRELWNSELTSPEKLRLSHSIQSTMIKMQKRIVEMQKQSSKEQESSE